MRSMLGDGQGHHLAAHAHQQHPLHRRGDRHRSVSVTVPRPALGGTSSTEPPSDSMVARTASMPTPRPETSETRFAGGGEARARRRSAAMASEAGRSSAMSPVQRAPPPPRLPSHRLQVHARTVVADGRCRMLNPSRGGPSMRMRARLGLAGGPPAVPGSLEAVVHGVAQQVHQGVRSGDRGWSGRARARHRRISTSTRLPMTQGQVREPCAAAAPRCAAVGVVRSSRARTLEIAHHAVHAVQAFGRQLTRPSLRLVGLRCVSHLARVEDHLAHRTERKWSSDARVRTRTEGGGGLEPPPPEDRRRRFRATSPAAIATSSGFFFRRPGRRREGSPGERELRVRRGRNLAVCLHRSSTMGLEPFERPRERAVPETRRRALAPGPLLRISCMRSSSRCATSVIEVVLQRGRHPLDRVSHPEHDVDRIRTARWILLQLEKRAAQSPTRCSVASSRKIVAILGHDPSSTGPPSPGPSVSVLITASGLNGFTMKSSALRPPSPPVTSVSCPSALHITTWRSGVQLQDALDRVDARSSRHDDVHRHHVRVELLELLHRLDRHRTPPPPLRAPRPR